MVEMVDRHAVVTGSTQGIGRQVAKQLVWEGYAVTVHGRDPERARKVCDAIGAADAIGADLSTPEGVATLAGYLRESPVAVLVNNAADLDAGRHPLLATPWSEYARLLATNAGAGLELAKAALPGMLERDDDGRLIWVGSEGAALPSVGQLAGPYLLSKLAVLELSRLFALEARGTTVTSNVVQVGPTLTERVSQLAEQMAPGADPAELTMQMYPDLLAGRPANPGEVAAAVAFLARPESSAVRGAVLRADGGRAFPVGA